MNKDNFFLIYMLFASIFCIFNLQGCAKRVIYKDVYIPTKCDIAMPVKPILKGDLLIDIAQSLEYSEILERDLIFCIGNTSKD